MAEAPVPPAFLGLEPAVVESIAAFRIELDRISVLDQRLIEFARLSAAVAIGAPAAPIATHIERALAAGATPDEIWGVVLAALPIVGIPRIIEALPTVREAVGGMTQGASADSGDQA